MNTEEQAKAKWCPFARSSTPVDSGWSGSYNRPVSLDASDPSIQCIGSECMAWRVEKGDAESDGAGNWLPVGYCGLAGQP